MKLDSGFLVVALLLQLSNAIPTENLRRQDQGPLKSNASDSSGISSTSSIIGSQENVGPPSTPTNQPNETSVVGQPETATVPETISTQQTTGGPTLTSTTISASASLNALPNSTNSTNGGHNITNVAQTAPTALGPLAVAQGPYVNSLSGEYLYVWAGAEGRRAADRLVTLDFNRGSSTYGRIVSQTLIPEPNASGNEPHHCGLSADGQTLICGGLLSLLKGQDEMFVFSLANPAMPSLVATKKGLSGSVPDDFYPLPDNTFVLTQMGSNAGGTPGYVVKVNAQGDILSQHPTNPPNDFNPHGIDIRSDLNLMITCDFVDPGSTLYSTPGGVVMRSSVRIWDFNTMEIKKTIRLPSGTGSMDCKLLKNHPQGLGYVGGSGNGKIYLYDPATGTATQVINLNADIVFFLFRWFTPTVLAQYMQISHDDSRLYIPYTTNNGNIFQDSGLYSGVAVYDISNPRRPRWVQTFSLPSRSGPHLSHLMGNRLIVTDYFLDQDGFGKIHLNGDHHVRSLNVNWWGLSTDWGFDVDFDRLVQGLKLRPHGMATNKR